MRHSGSWTRLRLRDVLKLAGWPVAGVVGLLSVSLAQAHPAFSFAGQSPAASLIEVVAGWSVIATGLLYQTRQPGNHFGVLLVGTGLAWFLVEWANPAVPSVAFTIGLVLSGCSAPLVLHAALAYPRGRLRSILDRVVLGLAYATNLLLLGLVPTLAFDPRRSDCAICSANLLSIGSNPALGDAATRLGLVLALVWASAAALIVASHLRRSTAPARRVTAPVLVPAIAFVGLFAADVGHSLSRGTLANDAFDQAIWFGEAITLLFVAAGVALERVLTRRTRARVAGLVVELLRAPPSGGLRDALAQLLDDPALSVGYPIAGGRLVDVQGRTIDQMLGTNRAVTRVNRRTHPVAEINHRADLLDDQPRIDAVVSAARLALESERLQAESRAQLDDLRRSRVRIVDTGDSERRRLERDLHDGAQQRLVSLAIAIRLVRAELGTAPDRAVLDVIDEADTELRAALADLRELARGIFPAVLTDEGLASAIQAMAESSVFPIQLLELTEDRFDRRVEAAAYFLIVAAASRAGATQATIGARRTDHDLVVEVTGNGGPFERLLDLEDRIGAVEGSVAISRRSDGLTSIRAEIPCAS